MSLGDDIAVLQKRLVALAQFDLGDMSQSRFSFSSVSSVGSPLEDVEQGIYTFYDSLDEDAASVRGDDDRRFPSGPSSLRGMVTETESAPISSYSLPHSAAGTKSDVTTSDSFGASDSSALTAPVDAGLDDLVTELSWIVGVI
jgi:hypothetical protein